MGEGQLPEMSGQRKPSYLSEGDTWRGLGESPPTVTAEAWEL